MTSQIRLRIEYLIHSTNILVLLVRLNFMKNLVSLAEFKCDFMIIRK